MSLTTLLLKLSLYDTDEESWIQADHLLTDRLVLAFKGASSEGMPTNVEVRRSIFLSGQGVAGLLPSRFLVTKNMSS